MILLLQVVAATALLGASFGEPIPIDTDRCEEAYNYCRFERMPPGKSDAFNSRKEPVSDWTKGGRNGKSVEFKGPKTITHSSPLAGDYAEAETALGITQDEGTKLMDFKDGIVTFPNMPPLASETKSPEKYDGPPTDCPENMECIIVWQQQMFRVDFAENCYGDQQYTQFSCYRREIHIDAPVVDPATRGPKGQYIFCKLRKEDNKNLDLCGPPPNRP